MSPQERQPTLEDILNECIDRLRRGATVDDCLEAYPSQAAELRPLLMTVQAVQARASQQHRRVPWLVGPIKAWAATAAMMVVFLGGFGVVQASSGTVPGNVLYPVKRTVERVQLAWPLQSDEAKARLSERLASRRADELAKVIDRGHVAKAEHLSERITHNIERAVRLRAKTEAELLEREADLAQEEASAGFPGANGPNSESPESGGGVLGATQTPEDGGRVPANPQAQPGDSRSEQRVEQLRRLAETREKILARTQERAKVLLEAKQRLEKEVGAQAERLRTAAANHPSPAVQETIKNVGEKLRTDYRAAIKRIDGELERIAKTRKEIEEKSRPGRGRSGPSGEGNNQGTDARGDVEPPTPVVPVTATPRPEPRRFRDRQPDQPRPIQPPQSGPTQGRAPNAGNNDEAGPQHDGDPVTPTPGVRQRLRDRLLPVLERTQTAQAARQDREPVPAGAAETPTPEPSTEDKARERPSSARRGGS